MGNKVSNAVGTPVIKQPTARSEQPTPTASAPPPALGEKAQKRAGLRNSFTTTQAPFTPAAPPAPASAIYARDTEEPANLANANERKNLVGFASQLNPVSHDAGNGNDICAGASVVNALILSGNPAKNASALRATFVASAATVPPPVTRGDIDRAFAAFSAGKMTTTDVSILQQVAYATLRTAQNNYDTLTQGDASAGVNPAALATALAQLKANGADLSDSTFSLAAVDGQPHWTVRAKGVTADSMAGEFPEGAKITSICRTAVSPSGRVFVQLPGKDDIVFKPSAAQNSPRVIQELLSAVTTALRQPR